jgi:ABC-type dipeptide/oligopeptide/nickel transport system ATPase component
MEKLLEVKNLKVEFQVEDKVIHAVTGVDLHINNNEIVVLAGESGSGKSALALALTRILPMNARITSGEVVFKGRDILGFSEKELINIRGKDIAYIFQEPASYLNPVYTIGSQISEVIVLHQQKSRKAADELTLGLLEQVRITDPKRVFSSYPHQLSGGMNQRAFIAMSLAGRPELLIADEPTTALDVTIEAQILELLLQLQQQMKFSMIFITHNLSIARRIAQRVIVMYQGKIVEQADTVSIFKAPKHFHTQELISAYEKIGRI